MQGQPKRCIFFGTTKSQIPDLIYQFLCLFFGLGPAARIFTKLQNHFSDEKVECSIDNFSG